MVLKTLRKTDIVPDHPDCTATAMMVAGASDLALMLDANGQILEVSVESADLRDVLQESWQGRKWLDTVVSASKGMVRELLNHVPDPEQPTVWREVHHRTSDGAELPIRYCAIPVGQSGYHVALGRDLRAVTVLKQQLLNAQQALEQDYWRLRQVETRYRLLFQMAEDGVLILDESTGRILEANPVAARVLGSERRSIVGQPFPLGFNTEGTAAVNNVLAEARTLGQAASTVDVALADGTRSFTVSANLLRHENESRFLIRIAGRSAVDIARQAGNGAPSYDGLIKHSPDAIVLTDLEGVIRAANPMFASLTQLANADQAVHQSLGRWLGRTGVDLNVLLSNLRRHGSVRLFSTTVQGQYGAVADVEVSAASFASGDEPLFGIFLRNVGRRVQGGESVSPLARSVEQLTERVGRVPLKELVRESTDLIEKLCIEAALEFTNNNRASAAELLGLSRQSLYAKLKRHDLGDFSVENGD